MSFKRGNFRKQAQAQKDGLNDAHKNSYNKKDDKGFAKATVFDMVKLKELNVPIWKPKEGEHIIDIIPFFAGAKHPEKAEGLITYNVDYWAHKKIGPMREILVCQQKTYQRPDRICTYMAKGHLPSEEWKALRPVRYCSYLVWVHDSEKEEQKGLQILDAPHYFFERPLQSISRLPRGGGFIPFSHYDHGKNVFFKLEPKGSWTDSQGNKHPSLEWTGFQFIDREEPSIPTEILDLSIPLDEVMDLQPEDDKWVAAFPDADGGQKQAPAPAQEPAQKSESRMPRKQRTVRDQVQEPVQEPTQEPVQEPEQTQEPAQESSGDEPECPITEGTFGVHIDQFPECDSECPHMEACAAKYDAIEDDVPY